MYKKWVVYNDNMACLTDIVTEDGIGFFHTKLAHMVRGEEHYEANAQLIVSAVNACISINKNNPMAVADGMGKVVGAADAFLEWFRTQGYNRETPQYRVLDHAVRDIKSQDRGEIE